MAGENLFEKSWRSSCWPVNGCGFGFSGHACNKEKWSFKYCRVDEIVFFFLFRQIIFLAPNVSEAPNRICSFLDLSNIIIRREYRRSRVVSTVHYVSGDELKSESGDLSTVELHIPRPKKYCDQYVFV